MQSIFQVWTNTDTSWVYHRYWYWCQKMYLGTRYKIHFLKIRI